MFLVYSCSSYLKNFSSLLSISYNCSSFSSLLSFHSYLLLFLLFCPITLIFEKVSILSCQFPLQLSLFFIYLPVVSEGCIFAK